MKILIGKDNLKQIMGIGISSNLELATKEALSSVEKIKAISVNVIGPENLMLKETQECLDKLRNDYDDISYTISVTNELKDKYVVIICKK